jgi:hypothetical protein
LTLGALGIAAGLAFWMGRSGSAEQTAQSSSTKPSATRSAVDHLGAAERASARRAVETDVATLGQALERGLQGGANQVRTESGVVYEETAAQREERHRMINAKITATLGQIPDGKRNALVALNDEALEIQKKQQSELISGRLSHEDYEQQNRQALQVQLEQLRALVSEDEYRKLTGLEPGVDPHEYLQTGVGGASNRSVPPPVESSGDKRR